LANKGRSNIAATAWTLHSKALQLGYLSVAWNPAAGTATVHNIRIYRDNGMIDVLRDAAFEVLRREGQLEAARR
jgi:hypothetical protein